MEDKLIWCFSIKKGLSLSFPNENLAREFEEEALRTLELFEKTPEDFSRWLVIFAYYAMYYKAYSLLMLLGVKSENHTCTIRLLQFIEKSLKVDLRLWMDLEEMKVLREIAQYKAKGEEKLKRYGKEFLKGKVVNFFSKCDKLKQRLSSKEIESLRSSLKQIVELISAEE